MYFSQLFYEKFVIFETLVLLLFLLLYWKLKLDGLW